MISKIVTVSVVLLGLCGYTGVSGQNSPPNIIFIMPDDHHRLLALTVDD